VNKGKDFEELVTLVESAVNNLPGVEVLHDVKLPTKYGGKRQIDIVLKENRGRFTYLTLNVRTQKQKLMLTQWVLLKNLWTASALTRELLYHQQALAQHLQTHRFSIYELKHTSKFVTINFREKKSINRDITLYTELFSPMINRKVSIVNITQDFLNRMGSSLVDSLVSKIKDPLIPQFMTGNSIIKINFSAPIIFTKDNVTTEIIGFYGEIESKMFTAPTETKNISEYKDAVQKKTFALVYEVEYDGKSYNLLQPKL
jgi:hypothetical protein